MRAADALRLWAGGAAAVTASADEDCVPVSGRWIALVRTGAGACCRGSGSACFAWDIGGEIGAEGAGVGSGVRISLRFTGAGLAVTGDVVSVSASAGWMHRTDGDGSFGVSISGTSSFSASSGAVWTNPVRTDEEGSSSGHHQHQTPKIIANTATPTRIAGLRKSLKRRVRVALRAVPAGRRPSALRSARRLRRASFSRLKAHLPSL